MSGLAILLSQTIIYWTLLILLIAWIIVFAVLALRPEPSTKEGTEGRAYSLPAAAEVSVVPEFQLSGQLRQQSPALQTVGAAAQSERDS